MMNKLVCLKQNEINALFFFFLELALDPKVLRRGGSFFGFRNL